MSNRKSIFVTDKYADPHYSHLEHFVTKIYRGFWTPGKYQQLIREVDVPYYKYKLPYIDKEAIRRCILAVALVEDKVKMYWPLVGLDFPQTIVSDIGSLIGQTETTHRRSYHSLNEELGVNVEEAKNHPALQGRINYLSKYLEKDPKIIGKKRLLKKLTLFTSLVERGSLFTQFYILMSYAKHNKGLKTISALQQSTAIEEVLHYNFGMSLINIVKEQHPELWDEYLVELISKNMEMAYQAELNLIDWFFEEGVPDHLTKEEVVTFLNDNFNTICRDLGLPERYEVNEDLYEEKCSWFRTKVFVTGEPDFFDNAAGGYADEQQDINLDTLNF